MRASILLVALVAVTACSDQASTDAPGDYRALAECSARMDAVSNLYAAIADTSSGDSSNELRSTGELRAAAARVLKAEAEKLAGAASAEVETIITETHASIAAEKETKPFEDFGVWLGSQADLCAPLVQEIIKAQVTE